MESRLLLSSSLMPRAAALNRAAVTSTSHAAPLAVQTTRVRSHPSTRRARAAALAAATSASSPALPANASASPAAASVTLGQQPGAPNTTQFHGDAARTGFSQNETFLNQSNVASGFGQIWQSPVLDGRVYATPVYADSITVSGSGNAANHAGDGVQNASFQNKTLGIVYAATGGGSVYAIAAQDTNGTTGIAPGTILWKTHLGNSYGGVDGNSIGVLSTPLIDLKAGRIYVTASVTDYLSAAGNPNHGGNNFEVFALSIKDGSLIAGWPLIFTQALLDSLNQNTLISGAGPKVAVAFSSSGADQRGALNLSADGSTLYVDWACYGASNPGWMTTVATGMTNGVGNGQTAAIVSAYSAIDTTSTLANGGMWGAGGPAIDAAGNVFVTTGDTPGGTGSALGNFGNSVLEFGPGQTLTLTGVYTPWNYPTQDTIDSDMGGGSPIVITLPAGSSTTTDLVATGGKQGNGYLLNGGNNLNNPTARPGSPASYPADLTRRPPVDANTKSLVTPNQDPSLYDTNPATGTRSYFSPAQVGPLALFLPYNESSASGNTAKARDTPTTFTAPDGSQYVIWAGSSKSAVGSSTPVAPSLYVTKVVAAPGQPAYFQIVGQNTAVMSNPGAGMVTANGTANEIDWIVDAGVQRTDGLGSFSNGAPTLYAYDALTMQPLWSSAYTELDMGGKYNSIADARGDLFLGTDRIQAFGLTGNTIVDDSVSGTGANQFNYSGAGWTHITGSSTMGTFQGTVSTDNVQGDFATLSFTGSQIKVYANDKTGYGSATFTVDGGSSQVVSLTPVNSSPNGQGAGDVLVYTVSGLGAGAHTLKILNNAASNTISVDRVEIVPTVTTHAKLGVSMTDGNVLPDAGGVISYTINYNNAGSILNATGVAASGVVLTETVPINTTADLANSTIGWTLTSGNGGGGSTYTFNVGALGAGVTGSVVFSVDLNASVPVGTTSVTNNVAISDAAADNATGNRQTPIPPAAESKLNFSQQPPTNGSAGIVLSPPITVAAQDQFGNTYTPDSSSIVTLTLNGGTFAGGGNTVTATLANGVATFNNLIISSAGTYTLTATDGALTSAVSNSFTVAASTKLGFVQAPHQTNAGVAMSPSVQVAIQDANGATITTDNSLVTLSINHGSFANGSTTLTALAVNGVATFTNLVINASGTYLLTATDGILAQAQSASFDIVAVATRLVFTRQPNNGNSGEAINPSVAVALEDGFGNIATGNTSNVTLTLSSGTFFGGGTTATAAAVNGIATFNNLVVTAPGTYTLAATGAGVSSANSNSFVIGTRTLVSIDDNNANNTGTIPQVAYAAPANWVRTSTALPNNFDGTITSDSVGGDTATVTFTGTLITVYGATSPSAGSAQIFIDGNNPAQVNLASATTAIAPIFTSDLLTAGTHTIMVKVVSGNVGIDRFVVGPATPTVSWATPADLTYGTALDGTQLDAFANVAGTFAYSPALGTTLHVGQNQVLNVTFTPNDTTNYNSATGSVLINVNKSTPVVTWIEPGPITYGQALTSAQLNATANVPGTFVYTPDVGTLLPTQDANPLSVTFTPTNTADYNSVTFNTTIDVNPATPVVTWPNPADIIDGSPLSATQLNATASVPGTFTYQPTAGTILTVGQHQALGVLFTPNDSVNYGTVSTSAFINVNYGPASKLIFTQQPGGARVGQPISPAVVVAVQDSAGTTLPGDGSTVTLTLNGGTFAGGGNTATAQAVNGVATFSNLVINTAGTYSLTATDASLTPAVSNNFNIGGMIFYNFSKGAADFASSFARNDSGTTPNGTRISYGPSSGILDGDAASAGGGVTDAVSGAIDESVIYTPTQVDLSDGQLHTVSEFVTDPTGLGNGDRYLQLGLVTASTTGFNGGFSFISSRMFGDDTVEFQYANGGTAVSSGRTAFTTAVQKGDWLQLIFTTRQVGSGSFQGTYSVLDYGATGVAVPFVALAPTAYSITGLTTIGTGAGMYAGFRSAPNTTPTSPLNFDNFAVDLNASKMAYIQQPASAPAGGTLATFVAVLEDANNNIVVGDSSTVTLTLTHDTFANGLTSVSAPAVNGIATFNNLVINTPGAYVLRATDSNPNLDPGFAPFVINGASKLGFVQQPSNALPGNAISPAVTVAVQDVSGNTVPIDTSSVMLTLNGGTFAGGGNTVTVAAVNGVATFNNLIINSVGSYTLTASDGTLTGTTSNAFAIVGPAAKLGFVQQPTTTSPGVAMSPAVTVTVRDAAGNTVPNNASTVTLTLAGGTFAGGGTTTTASAVNGVATFASLIINAAGVYSLTASDGSLTQAVSNNFAILSPVTTTIDDTVIGAGSNQIQYVGGTSGNRWVAGSQTGAFNSTNTIDSTTNDTATVSFKGVQVKYYAVEKSSYGFATILIDGVSQGNFNDFNATTTGNVLIFTSAVLTPGTHTIQIKVAGINGKTGTGAGPTVSIDRFDVIKAAPTVTWANPAAIILGTPLSGTQLNATAAYSGSSVPGTFTYAQPAGTILGAGQGQTLSVTFTPTDTVTYASTTATALINVNPATVVNRQLFYNNSYWSAGAGHSHDTAIDTSKVALLPGQTASFANYSGALSGINGMMVDISRLPGTPTLSDFAFKVGNVNNTSTWGAPSAAPSVLVRPTLGNGGSDRIELVWPDGAIQGQWLQVTVKATNNTGLASPDVFYFGNAIGETGNSLPDTFVDASDMVAIRDNITPFGSHELPSSRFDLNHDGFADASDMVVVRDHIVDPLSRLRFISPF